MQNLPSVSPREKTTNTIIYGFCVAMLGLGLSVMLTGRDKRAACQEELVTGIFISSVGMLGLTGMSLRRQTNNHEKIETTVRCILCAGMAILTGLALSGVQSAEIILRSLAVVISLSCMGKAAEVVGRRIASDLEGVRGGCWRLNEKVLGLTESVSNNITEVTEVVVNNITGISGMVVSNIIELKELAVNNVNELTEAAVKTCEAATETCKNFDEQVVLISTKAIEKCDYITSQFRTMAQEAVKKQVNASNLFSNISFKSEK